MSKWASKQAGKWRLLFLLIFLVACRNEGSPTAGDSSVVGDVAHNRVKIEIAADGMYRVKLADLQAAGLALESMDAAQLHLSQAGAPVSFHIQEDALIFYGQAPTSRYTAVRPYILESGKEGKTMAETAVADSSAPAQSQLLQTQRIEENHLYLSQARQDKESDVWFWQTVGQGQKLPLTINLAAVADGPATLRLHLRGTTHNPEVELDHDFDLILNGQQLDTIRWDGETLHTSETPLPAGLLKTGSNELILDNEITGASFLDIMEINWLEIAYMAPATAVNDYLQFSQTEGAVALDGFSGQPLIFNISDAAAPQLLTGWAYDKGIAQPAVAADMRVAAVGPRGFLSPTAITPLRQSNWRAAENQADLIIVTTDELAPALAPLIVARQAQELSVVLVPVAEIYDEFGYGVASPESIQTFVAYAYDNWQAPRPRYLFLVGDATTDYRNYQGGAPRNHIPSLLVPVQFSGETVSDSRLADVDGDMKPDLAVGRWPVNSAQDVENLVERTLAYEGGTAVNRALFAADGTETQFAAIAERLWTKSGLTDDETLLLAGVPAAEVSAAWNEGGWLTAYIGHGSVERWGKEDIFNPDAVNELNAATPPIVLQFTCLSGLFAHPELTSLSETMLLHERGPVLLVAATSLTLSGHQEPFALSLLQSLQAPANERIGDAFQEAKQALAVEDNGLREISDTFALIGDPSALTIRP
ncbi:MAG: hypothetical protein GY803_19870 [Chloroflexi bacterium]|nr:hypothetical protein [Chloroflexota bacterium]